MKTYSVEIVEHFRNVLTTLKGPVTTFTIRYGFGLNKPFIVESPEDFAKCFSDYSDALKYAANRAENLR